MRGKKEIKISIPVSTIKEWLAKLPKGAIIKVGLGLLIVVFLGLGLRIGWNCGSQGVSCSGGYTPPKPDDVRKILMEKKIAEEKLHGKILKGVGEAGIPRKR